VVVTAVLGANGLAIGYVEVVVVVAIFALEEKVLFGLKEKGLFGVAAAGYVVVDVVTAVAFAALLTVEEAASGFEVMNGLEIAVDGFVNGLLVDVFKKGLLIYPGTVYPEVAVAFDSFFESVVTSF
jgi:hypothetical protein